MNLVAICNFFMVAQSLYNILSYHPGQLSSPGLLRDNEKSQHMVAMAMGDESACILITWSYAWT